MVVPSKSSRNQSRSLSPANCSTGEAPEEESDSPENGQKNEWTHRARVVFLKLFMRVVR